MSSPVCFRIMNFHVRYFNTVCDCTMSSKLLCSTVYWNSNFPAYGL